LGTDAVQSLDHPTQPLAVETSESPVCYVLRLRDFKKVASLQVTPHAAWFFNPILRYQGKSRHDWDVNPTLPAVELPPWPKSAWIMIRVPQYSHATIDGVEIQWLPLSATHSMSLPAHTCSASDVTWAEANPMAYRISATLQGKCTVIFRQSFSPIWSISVESGTAKLGDHLQVDGFANAWLVDGSGPVTFRIVNRALYPYVWGIALTVVSLVLALGLAIRSWLRAAAAKRSATLPSPA
jgi:hypothetical protein